MLEIAVNADLVRMTKNRLEAFSDGVLAIIITIMVLELKAPHAADLAALKPLWPVFLSYVLSFIYVAIYWNNHHHMLHATQRINGSVLWANMHLLFWLSMVPFVTAWMGENHFSAAPTALYGLVLVMCAIAYTILQTVIIRSEGSGSLLKRAVGKDRKGRASMVLYILALPASFLHPAIAWGIYALVALIWLGPDSRIGRALQAPEKE